MIYRTIINMSVACTLSGTTYTYDDLIAIGRNNLKLEDYISKCNALYNKPSNTVSNTEKCTITISGTKVGNVSKYNSSVLTNNNTEEYKTTADLHAEINANNAIITSCVPTPSRLTLDTEITAGNVLKSEYDDVKAKRAKADSLKRELVPEHKYTRENQFEDPLYLETLNAEWNGWAALVFAATAGTILVYAFISSSSSSAK